MCDTPGPFPWYLPMLPLVTGVLAALLYLAGVLIHARQLSRAEHDARWLRLASSAAAALHLVCVIAVIDSPQGINLGLFAVASAIGLICVTFVLVATVTLPVANLLLIVQPIAAGGVLASLFLHSGYQPTAITSGPLIHIIVSLAAYSMLLLAASQALLLALQERLLRRSRSLALLGMMPPLSVMEDLLSQSLWAGLALLSLAIASGLWQLDDLFAQHVAHHAVLSIASWCVFATLLWGRYTRGWRGGTAVAWTLTGYVFLGLAYFGAKFVLEIIMH